MMCRRCVGIRGGDIDGNGVVWASSSAVISQASIDVSARKLINGPKATGDHHQKAGFYKYRTFDGVGDNSAEASYYTWVDQHNTLSLGDNVQSPANLNDGFVALKDGKMVMLRVPYPLVSTSRAWTAASTIERRLERPRTLVVGR
jgi:hypothetical protein